MKYYWVLILLLFGIFIKLKASLSDLDRYRLVDVHNEYRRRVAYGRVNNQPPASNLIKLRWNRDLEVKAQYHTDQCIFQHDSKEFREIPNYTWVGQNIAYWTNFGKLNVSEGVKMWFDEHFDYSFYSDKCSLVCGHYTQMVWATTQYVGCGINDCIVDGFKTKFLTCNYAEGGNWLGEQPYKVGAACSQCGKGLTCNEGLCDRII